MGFWVNKDNLAEFDKSASEPTQPWGNRGLKNPPSRHLYKTVDPKYLKLNQDETDILEMGDDEKAAVDAAEAAEAIKQERDGAEAQAQNAPGMRLIMQALLEVIRKTDERHRRARPALTKQELRQLLMQEIRNSGT